MRALVTGAHGFVGRHVARSLGAQGVRVVGLGHGAWPKREWERWGLAEWHEGNVDVETLGAYAGEPDAIFHCAGSGSVTISMSQPYLDFHRTVVATASVLEYLRSRRPEACLVYPSSAAVYGAAEHQPIAPSDPLRPLSPYGRHKLMAEELCRSYARDFKVRSCLVRMFSVYGIGLRKQLLWDACVKIGQGNAVFSGTGAETRDWVHVDDVADLMLLAARYASMDCPVLNGGSGAATTISEVIATLEARFDTASVASFSGQSRPGDPTHYRANIDTALSWGWRPWRDRVEQMNAYVDWFRAGAL